MKKDSRQRIWQIEQQGSGNCMLCGKKRERLAWRCNACAEKCNAYQLKRYHEKKMLHP